MAAISSTPKVLVFIWLWQQASTAIIAEIHPGSLRIPWQCVADMYPKGYR
jgi:hypothetical protein